MKRAACLVVLAVLTPVHALGAEAEDAYARVVVAEAELRAGPGVSHRVVYRAPRGEAFLISSRETTGFWLQVTLPDGRIAYVLGDTVEPVAAGDDSVEAARKPGFFAPPPLGDAHAGFAIMAGAYGRLGHGDGYTELRPAWVIAPAIALEPYIGLGLKSDSRRILYGGAGTLMLTPAYPLSAFVNIGAGGMYEEPKEEVVRESRKWFHLRAGAGLLLSLRFRVSLRLELSHLVLFQEDDYEQTQTLTAGLGTYF